MFLVVPQHQPAQGRRGGALVPIRMAADAVVERRRLEAAYAKVRAKVAERFNEDGTPREKVAETG